MGYKTGLRDKEWDFHRENVLRLELNTRRIQLHNERTAVRMPIQNSTSTFWVSLPTMKIRMISSRHEIMTREQRIDEVNIPIQRHVSRLESEHWTGRNHFKCCLTGIVLVAE